MRAIKRSKLETNYRFVLRKPAIERKTGALCAENPKEQTAVC